MPPHDIMAFNDYDKGVAYAKKVNKPVMLDFTGITCVNSRKMEEQTYYFLPRKICIRFCLYYSVFCRSTFGRFNP